MVFLKPCGTATTEEVMCFLCQIEEEVEAIYAEMRANEQAEEESRLSLSTFYPPTKLRNSICNDAYGYS